MADKKTDEVVQDSAELTEAEITKIKAEARAEVMKEMKAAARKELLEKEKDTIRAANLITLGKNETGDDLYTVEFRLSSYPRYAMIDGKVYHSNRTYTVNRKKAEVLLEMMGRTADQEERRIGEKNEFAHVPKVRKVLGKHGLQYLPA